MYMWWQTILLSSWPNCDFHWFLFQLHCVDDDQYLLDNQLYSLDYRPIDGDVSLPQNSFRTKDFLPHGKNLDLSAYQLICSLFNVDKFVWGILRL